MAWSSIMKIKAYSMFFSGHERMVSSPSVVQQHNLVDLRDPSLTLTQYCALLDTMLLCGAYETLP